MKSKEQKQNDLDAITKALPESSITIFTTFSRAGEAGLSVAQLEELKHSLREAEAKYVVVKKRLVEKAMSGLKYEGIDVFGLDGSIGLVLGTGDAYATAKALHQFAIANPSLKMFSAWMGDHAVSPEDLMEMATMPGKEELIVRLLGLLNYPLQSLAIVLNQIAESKPADATVESEPAMEEKTAEAPAEKEEASWESAEEKPAEESVATPNE